MQQTYTPSTYFTAEAGLGRAIDSMNNLMSSLENLRLTAGHIESQVADIFSPSPRGWAGLFDFIDQQAAANPDNTTWAALKERKDMVLADFRDAQARVQNINATIQDL
jgi:hypothetical protein